jgi:uncharacterized membrane protein
MIYLILGLAIFLGAHSVRILADGWRTQQQARLGPQGWRLTYSLVSLTGFALIIWGFGLARSAPLQLWSPPAAIRHLAALLNLLAFMLLAAAYVPGNRIKAWVQHPMVTAVMLWALAHLLANGNLAHVVLFGSFLLWAVADFAAARRRDQLSSQVPTPTRQTGANGVTVAIGVASWIAVTLWLHGLLVGVRPLG